MQTQAKAGFKSCAEIRRGGVTADDRRMGEDSVELQQFNLLGDLWPETRWSQDVNFWNHLVAIFVTLFWKNQTRVPKLTHHSNRIHVLNFTRSLRF